jgi:hypothetical protein
MDGWGSGEMRSGIEREEGVWWIRIISWILKFKLISI